MTQRSLPELDARAIAAGLALTIVVAVVLAALGFPPISSLLGIAAGGYTPGRMAGRAGGFHGAMIGVLSIIVASIAPSAGNSTVNNLLVDTLTIIVSHVLILLASAPGGWLATR